MIVISKKNVVLKNWKSKGFNLFCLWIIRVNSITKLLFDVTIYLRHESKILENEHRELFNKFSD